MLRVVVTAICCALSLFTLYTATFGLFTPVLQRGIHITLVLVVVLLLYPFKQGSRWWRAIDVLFLIGILSSAVYLYEIYPTIYMRIGFVTLWDKIFGALFIVVVLEACRRVVGWALTGIAIIFLAYGFFGYLVPGYFGHGGYDLGRVVTTMYFTTEGIFGPALSAAATFVALFIIFGTFLEKSGGSQVFIDLSTAVAGRRRGGPAKVAVFASALTGSINGSPVANVSTTGIFTIPLMKKVGYKPHVSGAIEAVASSGGSILPPVMGAGAFVMAEMAGLRYSSIALAAVIPAILYYLSLYCVVDFEAAKNRLEGLNKDELPKLGETLKKSLVLFIPLFVLIYFLVVAKISVTTSALYAIVAVIVTSIFNPGGRIGVKTLMGILDVSARRMLLVSVACAAAGLVVGVITLSGVGLKLSGVLLVIGENSMLLTLVLVMIGTLIVGMGLPPTPAYIVFSVLAVPALMKLDINLLTAHLFVFYFACFAPITPPVSLAAYTASGIASSAPMRTGWTAYIFALPAFLIPYMFVYGPQLLGDGSWGEIALSFVTASVGVMAFAGAIVGWFLTTLRFYERAALATCALALVIPNLWTDALGVGLLITSLLLILPRRRRAEITNGRPVS